MCSPDLLYRLPIKTKVCKSGLDIYSVCTSIQQTYSPKVNGSAYASQRDANQHQPNKETNKAAKQDEHYKREACARVSCFTALFVLCKQNL
jgi:hypothetical protein